MEISGASAKKRKKHGRISDVAKKLRLQSNLGGSDCKCRKLKCFEKVSENARKLILRDFNKMQTYDEQNSYLTGLISVIPIQRRRNRKPENEVTHFNQSSYKYRVRVAGDCDIQVCYKAFLSIHGITGRRVQTIQNSLKLIGQPPKDGRGKHKNRKHAIKKETIELVMQHISSFKGRSSHYSLNKTKKTYLPEDLNISKMYKMFKEKHGDTKISYDSYRSIFNEKFNISFGYPRSDTCSFCDEINVKLQNIHSKLSKAIDVEKEGILQQLKKLEIDKSIHLRKANTFYSRKTEAKKRSRKEENIEAICIDYSKNLSVPNISTNDVYYSRQLSVYTFIIHVLSKNDAFFYTYPETVGKKGSTDVCSLLHHMIYNNLMDNTRELQIFCDSCAGQNKNWTMFRYLHHVILHQKRLDFIHVTFPVRGHSYMECDKDFALVNQKFRAETPDDWVTAFKSARSKPSPFNTEKVQQNYFRKWDVLLDRLYKKKCPFASRPIKEIKLCKDHPRLLYYRTSFNGHWESADIVGQQVKITDKREFKLPEYSYQGKIAAQKFTS